jgi:transcriptional regulator GlxA family with amidase domain
MSYFEGIMTFETYSGRLGWRLSIARKESSVEQPFEIVFALYPGLTHLDFTGPHQFLCRIPNAHVTLASERGGEVESEHGMVFARTVPLAAVDECDLLCVPGGFPATEVALRDGFVSHIRRLGQSARYVTSVCTGSLILGAAGLLMGKRAACHWHWRHLLKEFGAIPDADRVVRDGHVITGGGVTAGIDFALTVVAEVAGERFAQALQLGLEYAPRPPFNSGTPDRASPEVLAFINARMQGALQKSTREVHEAAGRLLSGSPALVE